jgi:hypothetical protein
MKVSRGYSSFRANGRLLLDWNSGRGRGFFGERGDDGGIDMKSDRRPLTPGAAFVRAGVISSHAVARLVSVAFLAAARRACHRGSLAAFSGSRAMRVAGGSDFAVLGLPEGAL